MKRSEKPKPTVMRDGTSGVLALSRYSCSSPSNAVFRAMGRCQMTCSEQHNGPRMLVFGLIYALGSVVIVLLIVLATWGAMR